MSPNFENKREQPDFSTMVEKYKKDLMEYQRLQPASQEAVSPKTSPVSQERRNQGSVPVGQSSAPSSPAPRITTDQQLAQQHLKKENPPKMPQPAPEGKKNWIPSQGQWNTSPRSSPFFSMPWSSITPPSVSGEEASSFNGNCTGTGCGLQTKAQARIQAARSQWEEMQKKNMGASDGSKGKPIPSGMTPSSSPTGSGPEQIDRPGKEKPLTNQRWQEGPGQEDLQGTGKQTSPLWPSKSAFPSPSANMGEEEVDRRGINRTTEPPIGWRVMGKSIERDTERGNFSPAAQAVSASVGQVRKEIRKEQTSHDIGEGLKGCSPVLHKGAPQSFSPKEKQAEFQKFTDSQGAPVQDDKHSLTVGRNGPTLLADGYLLEKLAHFDRERIPERVVHAKGAGAFGEFTSYGTATPYTSAAFLQKKGEVTPVFTRFSTVIGGRGSADTVRDPRGFAVKFYTSQGNFDLVGNNLPVFFIRDAIQFPDVIHSLKPDPVSNLTYPQRFWDFISLTPEATHMITWLYSDRGTIASYRYMDGFSVNTYVMVNAEGKRWFVKFQWVSQQGIRTLDRHTADLLKGSDPDIAVKDLRCAIDAGDYPAYELCLQVMEPEKAEQLEFDPLDDTKTWDTERFPLIPVGRMVLNRNPDNFFAQVEQSAFCPANLIPGIEFSDDKMLTGRIFSYRDAQRYRMGINFGQLPVNQPRQAPANYQQDGTMRFSYLNGSVNYFPNRLADGLPEPQDQMKKPGPYVQGEITRQSIEKTNDFQQAGKLFCSFSPVEQEHLFGNLAVELAQCSSETVEQLLQYFGKADPRYEEGVRKAIEKEKQKKGR